MQGFDDIYFVTFASKNYRVSGGDSMRAYLRTELNLGADNSLLDTSPNLSDICKKAKAIVLLDDVVSTGMTMYGRIISLISKLKLTDYPNIKLYAAFICADSRVVNKKTKEIFNKTKVTIIPEIHEQLVKEITKDKYDNENDFLHALDVTSKYDRLIYKNKFEGDNEHKCIRGFKDSRLLLSFCYNTPNNTIAAFWRPSKISSPLFLRDSCQRHSMNINDLRTKQEQTRRNCYFGKVEK